MAEMSDRVPPTVTDITDQLKAAKLNNAIPDDSTASAKSSAKAARCDYISNGDIDYIVPRNKKLEQMLFSGWSRTEKGLHMENIENIRIDVIGDDPTKPIDRFEDMNLHPVLLETLIKFMGYLQPTSIQKHVVPAVLSGRDVVVSATTGCGKTMAYLCPVLSKLMGSAARLCAPKWNPLRFTPGLDRFRAEPLLLIIIPTRELALQVFDECCRLCYRSGLRPCVAYGGASLRDQRGELQKGCDVLIATPGRLGDFLRDPMVLSLQRVRYTVLDEADELMQDDWVAEMDAAFSASNLNADADHVFMMFSATFPAQLRHVAKSYMASDFLRIKAGRTGAAHRNIRQKVEWVDRERKDEALYDAILSGVDEKGERGRTMVFTNSKSSADRIDSFLYRKGIACDTLHGDRTQDQREDAISNFRESDENGKARIPVLITTDVGARGIDIPNVLHVINYDLPSTLHGGINAYVHRIGRCGRLGHIGYATSFYNDRNEDIGGALKALLIENGQPEPDCLQHLELQGNELEEGDSDAEEDRGDGLPAPGGEAEDAEVALDTGATW